MISLLLEINGILLISSFMPLRLSIHAKMKHVEVDFYFVHDKIAKGLLTVSHIRFEQHLAYSLTKPLHCTLFVQARSKIGVNDDTSLLWGRNNKIVSA